MRICRVAYICVYHPHGGGRVCPGRRQTWLRWRHSVTPGAKATGVAPLGHVRAALLAMDGGPAFATCAEQARNRRTAVHTVAGFTSRSLQPGWPQRGASSGWGLAPLTPSVPLASIPSTSTGLSVHAASEEALTVIYHSARAHLCQDLYRHVGYNLWPLALLHRCLDKGKDVSLTLVRVTRQAVTSTVPDTWQHHVEGVARRGITPLPGRPPEAIIVHRTCG